VLLPSWHLLAAVEEEYNAIYLRCASAGDLSFFGKGAGALPTAAAVLGDLIDLAQDNSARWPPPASMDPLPADERVRRHFLRVTARPGQARSIGRLIRGHGVPVQSEHGTGGALAHTGYLLGPSDGRTAAALAERLRAAAGDVLVLGVLE
jgi:homoserine dehydrogenase